MTLARAAALLLATATAASAQEPETGTFTLLQNGTTLATESFTRSDTRFESTLVVLNEATIQAEARLQPDATISRLEVRMFGPEGQAGEPVQTSAVTFSGGTVALEQPIGSARGEPAPVEAGAIPYINPSPSFMEQILRRARTIGGQAPQVTVWIPGPVGGQTATATVTFDGDDAALSLGGIVIEVETDAVGRLLAARVPTQSLVIERN